MALLREAGCTRDGGVMRLPSGKPLEIEFLDNDPVFQPVTQPFIRNLGLIGIRASIRLVDASQYQARVKDFDFDLTARRFASGLTPGPELREAYGSRAAATPGSNNLAGIAEPGHRRPHRRGDRGDLPRRHDPRLPRARPGAAGRALLGSDVVQGRSPARALGRLRPPGQGPDLRSRRADVWWYDAAKARRIGRI